MYTFKVDISIVEKELPEVFSDISATISDSELSKVIWHYYLSNNPPIPTDEVKSLSFNERVEYETKWFSFALYYELNQNIYQYETNIIPPQVQIVIKNYVILLLDKESAENLDLDRILEKISTKGIDTLTDSEKNYLNNY